MLKFSGYHAASGNDLVAAATVGDRDNAVLLESAYRRDDILLSRLDVAHADVVQILDIRLKALPCT